MPSTLKIGSRKSDLARVQTDLVSKAIKSSTSYQDIQCIFKESFGDQNLNINLSNTPAHGVFTKDLTKDLLEGRCDLVVHSWKDLPVEKTPGTEIAATLPRADQRDVILFKKDFDLKKSRQITILTSSPRREKQLPRLFSEIYQNPLKINFKAVRGNIPTRLKKLLTDSDSQALVLAKAALDRLFTSELPEHGELRDELRDYLNQFKFIILPLTLFPTAAAQGAFGIETRAQNSDLLKELGKINHKDTYEAVQRERQELQAVGGGCQVSLGVSSMATPFGWLTILDDGLQRPRLKISESWLSQLQKLPKPFISVGDEVFNFSRNKIQKIDSKTISQTQNSAVLISKTDAYAPELVSQASLVWAPGISTWRKLVSEDVWVHGCSDFAGFDEMPEPLWLTSQPLRKVNLTYNKTELSSHDIVTYTLSSEMKMSRDDFLKYETYYWPSFERFKICLEKFPELARKNHVSGLGESYRKFSSKKDLKYIAVPNFEFLMELVK